jgi:hypothetical protein
VTTCLRRWHHPSPFAQQVDPTPPTAAQKPNSQTPGPDWPYPVVELFLGHLTLDATLAAATKPDQRCEGQFYVGEWHLSRGDLQAAKLASRPQPQRTV